jgi:thiol-disulfide isomerase/thioredoxin
MKTVKYLFAALIFGAASMSCDGGEPVTQEDLLLKVDKPNILADGEDTATFTVLQGDVDVTDKCSICIVGASCLPSNVFFTTDPGELVFYAYFTEDALKENHQESNHVTLVANEAGNTDPAADFDPTKRLDKSVTFFVTTATWCEPCYYLKNTMKPIEAQYGGRFVGVNLYTTEASSGKPSDPIVSTRIADTFLSQLQNEGGFNKLGGYPNVIVDLDYEVGSSGGSATTQDIQDAYSEFYRHPVKTGIRFDSRVDQNEGTIEVAVTVGARQADTYKVGVILVEDHVEAAQAASGTDKYDHTRVLRDAATTNVFGDELGAMEVGDVRKREYSLELKSEYDVANLSVIVYTLCKNDSGKWAITGTAKAPVGIFNDFKYLE